MKRRLTFLILFYILTILSTAHYSTQAQGRGPVVDILGKPETTPPDAHVYVSVIDPDSGRAIDELEDANFSVQVSEQDVEATVSSETRGVAVIMVVDRGGIARRGDPRIGQAVDLAGSLQARQDGLFLREGYSERDFSYERKRFGSTHQPTPVIFKTSVRIHYTTGG